jgi:hypothetical protein
LVDVLLEGKVDPLAPVGDEALLLHRANVLSWHARAQPRFDVWVFEVEEVPRVVPDEAILFDGLAIAADLFIAIDDEVVFFGTCRGERNSRKAADSCPNDEQTA